MLRKKNRIKRFREDVSRHVRSRYPRSRKGAILYMSPNKVMSNVDMFGSSGNSDRIRQGTRSLVVRQNRERGRYWKMQETQENTQPERLLERVCHSVIFSLRASEKTENDNCRQLFEIVRFEEIHHNC